MSARGRGRARGRARAPPETQAAPPRQPGAQAYPSRDAGPRVGVLFTDLYIPSTLHQHEQIHLPKIISFQSIFKRAA